MANEKKPNVHAGHRQRIDAKVKSIGLDAMPQHEQLEYMLYQIIAQGDTCPIAHELLQKFGSLERVFHASERELMQVNGVGARTAKFISQIPAIAGIYQRSIMGGNVTILDSIEKIGEFATTLFGGKLIEEVYIISLAANKRLLRHDRIATGGVSNAPIYVRNIIDVVMASKAHSVVMAHNHPSGELLPSADDVMVTQKVAAALGAIDVKLLDHVIVSGKKYVSLRKSGIIF